MGAGAARGPQRSYSLAPDACLILRGRGGEGGSPAGSLAHGDADRQVGEPIREDRVNQWETGGLGGGDKAGRR